jgi:hypothetical protein
MICLAYPCTQSTVFGPASLPLANVGYSHLLLVITSDMTGTSERPGFSPWGAVSNHGVTLILRLLSEAL